MQIHREVRVESSECRCFEDRICPLLAKSIKTHSDTHLNIKKVNTSAVTFCAAVTLFTKRKAQRQMNFKKRVETATASESLIKDQGNEINVFTTCF